MLIFLFLIGAAVAEPLQKSSASNVNPQRTAYLMEHYLGGNKNVRWETRPMATLDQNGKQSYSIPFWIVENHTI